MLCGAVMLRVNGYGSLFSKGFYLWKKPPQNPNPILMSSDFLQVITMIADDFTEIARRLGQSSKTVPPALPYHIIYFDSNANTLTPAAHSIIESMATHIIRAKPAAVRCIGHTDAVGDLSSNHVLGMQRSLIVKSWLQLRGVPANLVTCTSEGSRKPRVQTAQGISESENRRVEVVLE